MSIRSLSLLASTATVIAALAVATPAAAVVTTVNFNTTTTGAYTTTGSGTTTAATFKSTELVGGAKLNVRVTGWHAVDQTGSGANADTDSIEAAQLGIYDQGLGVIANGDNGGANNLHQIDNLNGVDFVLLQFDRAVTLTGFGRNLFALDGISPSDSDAAFWGDTGNLVSSSIANYSYNSTVPLASYSVSESTWTEVVGAAANNTATFSGAGASSVWLIGADFKATRNDGFKLSTLAVTVNAAAVPEPATWGMMLVGFGAVGMAARRRRGQPAQAVAA